MSTDPWFARSRNALRWDPLILAAAALACAFAFAPAFGLYRFHDDWRFVDRAANAVATDSVAAFIARPFAQHWSPLWHAIETANFLAAGWEADWFVRTVNLAALFTALLLLASLLAAAGSARPGIVAGMAVLAAHHATAAARYSFDTYSQSLSDLGVWAAGAALGSRMMGNEPITTRNLTSVGAILVAALFLKEQALGGMLVVSLLLIIAAVSGLSGVGGRRVIATIGSLAVLAIAFALARRAMGVSFDSAGAFRLCAGCVPQNVGLLLAALLVPVRTITVFDAWTVQPRDHLWLVGVALAVSMIVGVMAMSIGRAVRAADTAGGRGVTIAIAGLLSSWFPVALLGQVGELYVHTGVFWWAMLVGLSLDASWRASRRNHTLPVLAGAVYVVLLGAGLMKNLSDMRATGERARQYLERTAALTADIPAGDLLLVTSPEPFKRPGDYGLYRVTSPQVLVMTGLSPASIRHATAERLRVMHEEALHEPDHQREMEEAQRAGRLHVLVLDHAGAFLR